MSAPSNGDLRVKWDIAFKYYQEQWTHVRHHESLRSALTFQVLAGAVAVVAAYFKIEVKGEAAVILRMLLATISIALGLIGWIAVVRIERAAKTHIKRARAARESLGFLEPFAAGGYDFPQLRPIYLALNALVVTLGVCLLVATGLIQE